MPNRRPVNWFLSAFIVIGIIALLTVGLISISHTDSGRDAARAAATAARIVQQNTDRTECIRSISNDLDHAHWDLIGKLFLTSTQAQAQAIGLQLSHLPLVVDLADSGGFILKTHFDPCPPAPTKEIP